MEDVYVFSEDAPYDVIDRYREGGLPSGLRYAASVTGPWRIFGIYQMDDLRELPGLTRGAIGSETAHVISQFRVLKTSVYHPVSAFVRIQVAIDDPEPFEDDASSLLATIRDIVRDERSDEEGEAELVMGAFDILAYVGGDEPEDLGRTIRAIRALPEVTRTVSLRVIDYVSTSAKAPEDHRVPPAASAS